MAKKPVSHKQRQAAKKQQENQALQNVLNVFLVGLVAECFLLVIYRYYLMGTVDSLLFWHRVLQVCQYAGPVLLLASIAGLIWKKDCPKCRKILPYVAVAGLFFGVAGWMIVYFFDMGVTLMCILVPVVTLLGLVYFLFQRECFTTTTALALAMFTTWVCSTARTTPITVGCVAIVLLLAVLAGVTFMAKRDGGSVKGVRLFPADCNYTILFAAFAVAIAAVVLALAVSSVTYYLMWALGILLFAEMVYYTTKLM